MRPDPAMLAGIDDAVTDIRQLSESRLRRFVNVGGRTLERQVLPLGMMAAGYLTGAGPAIVLREAAELYGIVDDFASRALLVAAQHNLAVRAQAPVTGMVLDGETHDGLDATTAPLAGLARVHTRLRAEATAATYTALWEDRWQNPLSLGAIGRGLGMSIAERATARGDLQEAYRREVARRAQHHLEAAALSLPRAGATETAACMTEEGREGLRIGAAQGCHPLDSSRLRLSGPDIIDLDFLAEFTALRGFSLHDAAGLRDASVFASPDRPERLSQIWVFGLHPAHAPLRDLAGIEDLSSLSLHFEASAETPVPLADLSGVGVSVLSIGATDGARLDFTNFTLAEGTREVTLLPGQGTLELNGLGGAIKQLNIHGPSDAGGLRLTGGLHGLAELRGLVGLRLQKLAIDTLDGIDGARDLVGLQLVDVDLDDASALNGPLILRGVQLDVEDGGGMANLPGFNPRCLANWPQFTELQLREPDGWLDFIQADTGRVVNAERLSDYLDRLAAAGVPACPVAPVSDRVEICSRRDGQPGLTIPWDGLCITEGVSFVRISGHHIKNLDFLADFASAGMRLSTLEVVNPQQLEDISGLTRSRIREFRLANRVLDPALLAPLGRTPLRRLTLDPLPDRADGTVSLGRVSGLLAPEQLEIRLDEGMRLDMNGFDPGAIKRFSLQGPADASVDFSGLMAWDAGLNDVRIAGLRSDLRGLNRPPRLARLELFNTRGGDYRRLAALTGLRALRIVGLHGDGIEALHGLTQLRSLDLHATADPSSRDAAAPSEDAVRFDPACLAHWPGLERVRLDLGALDVDLEGRDAIRGWLAGLGPAPAPDRCRSAPATRSQDGGNDGVAGLAGALRSYPLPERGRARADADLAPEAGLILLRGRPHGEEDHLAILDYRRGSLMARDIPAGRMRSALEFRGEVVPRILQNAGDTMRARISPDGRYLVTHFPDERHPFLRVFDVTADGREVAQVPIAEPLLDGIVFLGSGPDRIGLLLLGRRSGLIEVSLRRDTEENPHVWSAQTRADPVGLAEGPTAWHRAKIAGGLDDWALSVVLRRPHPTIPGAMINEIALGQPGQTGLQTFAIRGEWPLEDHAWLPGPEVMAVASRRSVGVILPDDHLARIFGLESDWAWNGFDSPQLHYLPERNLLLLTDARQIVAFDPGRLLDWLARPDDDLLDYGVVLSDEVEDLPNLTGHHHLVGAIGQETLVVLHSERSGQAGPDEGLTELPLAPLLDRL